MGTNFYWRTKACGSCGRFDEMHVGKSSPSFHGHFDEDPATGDDRPSIVSWADWKSVLRSDGELWDEYGVQQDVEEFIARIEAVDPARRRRQHDAVIESVAWRPGFDPARIGRVAPGCDWLDAEGFSFHGGDYS